MNKKQNNKTMTIPQLFFMFVSMLFMGLLMTLANALLMFKTVDITNNNMRTQMFAVLLYVVGSVGTVLTSIAWIVMSTRSAANRLRTIREGPAPSHARTA